MNYEKYLAKTEHVLLAYLGGPYVFGQDRRLRVDEPRPEPGFYRFAVTGRKARAVEAVDAVPMEGLPKSRGHVVAGFSSADTLGRVHLLPAEEPLPFAIVRARRWHSGELVFESFDFDGEIEEAARDHLERRAAIGELSGVPASLRVAYGVALGLAVAESLAVPLSVREASAFALSVSDGGEPAAREAVLDVRVRRQEAADRARFRSIVASSLAGAVYESPAPAPAPLETRSGIARHVITRAAASADRRVPTADNARQRVEATLEAANARLLRTRALGGGNLEVRFAFMDETFVSVVDAITLRVHDAGVCLAGEDDLVTLESLPSVIREAIDTDRLVITRR